jgi:chemotaxis response regulator CheB
MAPPQAPRTTMRADERLSRLDQQAEEFVQSSEQPLESLIVIGASAGGYVALQDAVKGLSRNLPPP